MKKKLIPLGAILLSGFAHAQLSSTENYIQSRTYLEPVTTRAALQSDKPKLSSILMVWEELSR